MNKLNFKKWMPHLLASLIFIVITISFLQPLIEGKVLRQEDILRHKGMSKEIMDFREQQKEEALWTNSMFGGMPAYQISVLYASNLIQHLNKFITFTLPSPAGYIFLYMIGFYILLLTLRVNPWTAIIGSIAFAFSTYYIIIIEAGHNSKAHAVAYMAPVLAGMILTYQGKRLLGACLFALSLALEINSNHLQITYYLAIALLIYALIEFIYAIKAKQLKNFFIASSILTVVSFLSIGSNITNLWTTYEYGKYSTRGKTELTKNQENQTSGLDKEYATSWSYGISESFSLLIPNFKGGESTYIGENETALSKVDPQMKQAISQQNQYFGDQPFVSGPTYVGAIICFLFVLGCFVVKGKIKWFILSATLLSLFLGWGKNLMPLTDFFLDYVPGYNKFRTVSMIMVILELTIPLMAILTLTEIIKTPSILKEKLNIFNSIKLRYLDLSFALTGGLALLFWLLPTTFNNFITPQETEMINNQISQYQSQAINNPQASDAINQYNAFAQNLETARISIFKADAIRSFIFILLAFATILLFKKEIIKKNGIIAIIGLLILIDMWSVNKRYVNEDNFISKRKLQSEFTQSNASTFILNDKTYNNRVLNLTVSTFNDAHTSYYHQSIGGYHGAKLKRYQELIDFQLGKELELLIGTLQNKPTDSSIKNTLSHLPALNMLNTKYIIYHPDAQPLINTNALGNAWFVNEIKWVNNADEEIDNLKQFNPKTTALVDVRYKDIAKETNNTKDTSASIILKSYKPNLLVYSYQSNSPQTVIFSEIFYDAGWNVYINNEKTPYFRANYVLRGLSLPKGKYDITFKFEPNSYYIGENISLISSILLLAGIAASIIIYFTRCKKNKTNENC